MHNFELRSDTGIRSRWVMCLWGFAALLPVFIATDAQAVLVTFERAKYGGGRRAIRIRGQSRH